MRPCAVSALRVDGAAFADAIKQVTVGASVDSARPVLTGVQFEDSDAGMRMVATDSYRLAVRTIEGVHIAKGALVPARALREIPPAIGSSTIQVSIGDREASFASERGSMTVRLIEGAFPDYRRLLPDAYPNRLVLDKATFMEALGRAALVAEDHIPVRLQIGAGGVEVTVTRQDVGGEVEQVEGTYEGEDESVLIAFNPRYLNDGVAVIQSDEIEIQVRDGQKPSVLRGVDTDDFLYLLMPIRI